VGESIVSGGDHPYQDPTRKQFAPYELLFKPEDLTHMNKENFVGYIIRSKSLAIEFPRWLSCLGVPSTEPYFASYLDIQSGLSVWCQGGARRHRAYRQHSSIPPPRSKGNL